VRDVMYWGKVPALGPWLATLAVSALIGWLGFAWFQKTRKGFADVI
jgi:lipopolysaccharide transport system permease protein